MSIATESRIIADYARRTRKSAELFARAQKVLPSGIVHDSRLTGTGYIAIRRDGYN